MPYPGDVVRKLRHSLSCYLHERARRDSWSCARIGRFAWVTLLIGAVAMVMIRNLYSRMGEHQPLRAHSQRLLVPRRSEVAGAPSQGRRLSMLLSLLQLALGLAAAVVVVGLLRDQLDAVAAGAAVLSATLTALGVHWGRRAVDP